MKLVVYSFAMILLCGSSMQQSGKSVLEMFPEFNDLKTKMQAQIAEVESIGNNVDDLMNNVAFSATIENAKNHTWKSVINFPVERIDTRNAFSNGYFTVPVTGTYIFIWTISCRYVPGFAQVDTQLLVNQEIRGKSLCDATSLGTGAILNHQSTASNSVVTHVTTGQRVFLKIVSLLSINEVIGNGRSSFSGYRLF